MLSFDEKVLYYFEAFGSELSERSHIAKALSATVATTGAWSHWNAPSGRALRRVACGSWKRSE
eukprot:2150225-Prymnesium_polylepis.1